MRIVARIPRIDVAEPNVRRAIGHTLLGLLEYPHEKVAEWSNWISVSPYEVEQVAARWRALQPPIAYESFEVFGPACLAGRFYRVVGWQIRAGGRGWSCEVWDSGRWMSSNDGPGGKIIMAAVPASAEELAEAGVDCFPVASNYDPLAVECEGTGAEPGA